MLILFIFNVAFFVFFPVQNRLKIDGLKTNFASEEFMKSSPVLYWNMVFIYLINNN